MYHPSRGGVRGGRDQFKWDDVKVDKHRENYLGHSVKAPVGRWQKGKDLSWYARDKKSESADMEAAKAEIKRIKEEEEQAMLEALGLAPQRASRPQGNRLDKHEFSELVKRGSTAEDLGGGHAEAARVQGLGFLRAPRSCTESSCRTDNFNEVPLEGSNAVLSKPQVRSGEEVLEKENKKKRRHEENHHHHHHHHEKHDKRHSHDTDEKKKHKREKGKRRNGSD